MSALRREITIPVLALASPVYWPDPVERAVAFERLEKALRAAWAAIPAEALAFQLVDAEPGDVPPAQAGRAAVFIPMSGGVQPWMRRLAGHYAPLALVNAYLPGDLPADISGPLLHRNAHPACTDFFALRRLAGRPAYWMYAARDVVPFWRAVRAVARLRAARLLQVGETEPWVINSCRSLPHIRERFGVDVVTVPPEVLYARVGAVPAAAAGARARAWIDGADGLVGVTEGDVASSCRVALAMEDLLRDHGADGLAMACFAMIRTLDTTSCIAMSMLNEAAATLGACEGDLDAALTLLLLKALGADFVWIANPILYDAPYVDLVHCTAPRCAAGQALGYRLLRHHESGRGVAPEVVLPSEQAVTLARIGNDLRDLVVHPGRSERRPKLGTCHTQLRVHLLAATRVLDTLPGTHLVLAYGDYAAEARYAADLLGLRLLP